MRVNKDEKILPFSLVALVIILDQITKTVVVKYWPIPEGGSSAFIADIFKNDILLLYHVRNNAIAFSLGEGIPPSFRLVLFIIVPVAVLAFLVWYYFSAADFNRLQRWAIAGIIGGGTGNIIDRVFRRDGVVDFISVKFYGLFGLQRWPTFNIADASVVVCSLLLLATMINPRGRDQ
jgi:signal peptidase II